MSRPDETDEHRDYGASRTEYGYETEDEGDDDGWWDEGLITLLIVGGVILFLFPEPATSGFGVLLISLGVLAWVVDWLT